MERQRIRDAKANRGIKKYGLKKIIEAYYLHHYDGNGASSVGIALDVHMNAADSMIDCGRIHVEKIGIADREAYCKRWLNIS